MTSITVEPHIIHGAVAEYIVRKDGERLATFNGSAAGRSAAYKLAGLPEPAPEKR